MEPAAKMCRPGWHPSFLAQSDPPAEDCSPRDRIPPAWVWHSQRLRSADGADRRLEVLNERPTIDLPEPIILQVLGHVKFRNQLGAGPTAEYRMDKVAELTALREPLDIERVR